MSILLPCDLATWPSVTSYLEVLASGLDSVQDVVVTLLQIHNLCNIAILNEDDSRPHDDQMFGHLFEVVENQFTNEDRERFLRKNLPCIAKCAAALPQLKPSDFSYILASLPKKVHLDRRFVASLIANAFLSTLPLKAKELMPFGMPDVTFATLFPNLSSDFCSALRFKGFLEYFDILEEEGPCGRVSYELKCRHAKELQKPLDVPKKPLAPVFIVEEEIRPMDLSANVDILIVKDMASLRDMSLQHPELVPLLLLAEPKLKENEWIEIRGLMARNSTEVKKDSSTDDACICIVERSNQLSQDGIAVAQGACYSILNECYKQVKTSGHDVSSNEQSLTSSVSSKLPSSLTSSERAPDSSMESEKKPRIKRQCFAERLKMAMERGCTPDDESSNPHEQSMANGSSVKMMRKRRYLSEAEENPNVVEDDHSGEFGSNMEEDAESSFSEDSAYSFESLILAYEMEGEYEDIQRNLMKPLGQDEQCNLRSLAITDELKRMSLSDAYLDRCLHLETTITPIKHCSRRTRSDLGRAFKRHRKQCQAPHLVESTSSRLPIWIVNSSSEVDSKRFLVEWLSASLHDIPLVVYQSSNGSLSTDVVAAICSWIEEQSWTTDELSHALAQGGNNNQYM